jgi:acyl carrier protein
MINTADAVIKIKSVLHDQFGIDSKILVDSTRLSDLGIDSLHLVDVMLDLETELDITLENLSFSPETTLEELGRMVSLSFKEAHDN